MSSAGAHECLDVVIDILETGVDHYTLTVFVGGEQKFSAHYECQREAALMDVLRKVYSVFPGAVIGLTGDVARKQS